MNKEFTLKTFEGMLDKVVFWNSLAGNLPEDKTLEPVYLQLTREEMFGKNEFLQGWFTGDKVMQADGIADLLFTGGMLSRIQKTEHEYDYIELSTNEVVASLAEDIIDNSLGVYDSLYALCLKMSEVMDVEAVFNAVYESNMTKYVHEVQLGDFDLDEEVRIIEEQNRYSGVDYHKVGSYYIFTARQDVQSGVVFDKPKIVKPSTFKEVQGLAQFIY